MVIYFYLFFYFMHMSIWDLVIFLEQCNILSLVYLNTLTSQNVQSILRNCYFLMNIWKGHYYQLCQG